MELTAEGAGVTPGRIIKNLSFYGEEGAILVVTARDAKIVSRKFKTIFHRKSEMIRPEDCGSENSAIELNPTELLLLFQGYKMG